MEDSPVETVVAANAELLARKVADWFVKQLQTSEGTFRVALSGGSTPRGFYRLISGPDFREWVPWDRLQFFWGDERFVSHDSPDSNYRMVREAMLSRVPLSLSQIHPMPVDGTPKDAARSYETTLQGVYGATRLDRGRPLFDVVFLGLGDDGHIASLLPNEPVLNERERWVAAVEHGRKEPRLTLTFPAIESSRSVAFLVTGAGKAAAVRSARAGDPSFPAGRLKPQGRTIWFLDKDAAG